ncbi:hypothetical protein TNIN_303481 [Trichonephila inaurata madagascariensis]|uniref:3-hydroxyisobutyrate dehydrogenase-like NAD-binding domain-containing protein n=1 Tax=Trichonephila inaurata madagascariensis TaxID=2747483 RepID=A0A8X6YBK4_9ARAC|nr:hypothetical protein TNIN_303481 [Trichonephila inaurata madagascariensis]
MNFRKRQFLEILSISDVACPLYLENSQAIVENKFLPDTSLKNQQQDLSMALSLGERIRHSMPLVSAANEMYKKCRRLDYSEHDISAAYLGVRNYENGKRF